MNIEPYIQTLRDLHAAVDLSDRIGSLQLYGAASAIYRDLLQFLGAEPEDQRPQNYHYIIEKLSLFMEYFSNAIIVTEGSHKTPAQWLESASDNLMKVEISI